MKKTTLWIMLFAFLFGQGIQLVTCAMAHYLYVSDPVMMCITVGIVTVMIAVITSVFTMMSTEEQPSNYATYKAKHEGKRNVILPIVMDNDRPPLDTDNENIDKIDRTVRKEDVYAILNKRETSASKIAEA